MPHRDERARLSPQRTSNHASPPPFPPPPQLPNPQHEIDPARQSYIRELAPQLRLPELNVPALPPPAPVVPLRRVEPTRSSSLSPRAAARRLIEALVDRGVDTFFGVPGGPVCPVFEAIRLESRARLIESRHESHAAFAATLYQRASGKVPAVVVTAGPGITNAITGIASASLERAPMLVIAGDVAWATSGGVMAQDSGPEGIDMEAMLAPITRAQVRAAHARSVVCQALSALDIAEDPTNPGPVLFVLPLDRAMEQCESIEVFAPPRPEQPAPPRTAVARTAAWLMEAKRPLIVLGAGCRGHEKALRELVDMAAVPVVTTPRAKGMLNELHPWSLRNGGMAASLWARRYTAEPIDVCLVLGTDLDDTSMGPTRYVGSRRACRARGPRCARVRAQPAHHARRHLRRRHLCRARSRVKSSKTAYTTYTPGACWWRPSMSSPFDAGEPAQDGSSPIRPHRLLSELESAVGPRAQFVTDIGEHMLFCLHYLTARSSDSFHVQLNLGSMGSGIAGAIGLSLSDRTRRIVCVAGDGGMQMSGMEALVAVRERLPILFVVFNDGRYNMVHHGMRQIFGEASDFATPQIDFAAWAKSFGMPARIVREPGEVTKQNIDALLANGGPALIDARIDASARIRGGGRVEALQHMSMLSQAPGAKS